MSNDKKAGFSGAEIIKDSFINTTDYAIRNVDNKKIDLTGSWFYNNDLEKAKKKIKFPDNIINLNTKINSKNFSVNFGEVKFPKEILNGDLYEQKDKKLHKIGYSPLLTHQGYITGKNLYLNNTYKLVKNSSLIEFQRTQNITNHNLNFKVEEKSNHDTITFNININSNNYPFSFKHYKPDKKLNNKSVILAGGLWSSFDTWESQTEFFLERGYEVYVIALTGEFLECNDCLNYKYSDIVNTILPKYIQMIKNYDNSQELIYIGHSNGGRTLIDSLKKHDYPISKYILLGVPGSFNHETPVSLFIRENNKRIQRLIEEKKHISIKDIIFKSLTGAFYHPSSLLPISSSTKISTNLYSFYQDMMVSSKHLNPPSFRNETALFVSGKLLRIGDGVVSYQDNKDIAASSTGNITYKTFPKTHTKLNSHPRILALADTYIKGEEFK